MHETLQPGQILARGVSRHLLGHGFSTLTEFVPASGLRVDVIALGQGGEIWIIECKSCRADFLTDHKWQGYVEWCDRFFWCVDKDFPTDILPDETGLIIADGFDAAVIEYGPETKMAGARRKVLTKKIARVAMSRLRTFQDPVPGRKFEIEGAS